MNRVSKKPYWQAGPRRRVARWILQYGWFFAQFTGRARAKIFAAQARRIEHCETVTFSGAHRVVAAQSQQLF